MAAQEHLNKTLFHGTGGEIHGGIVKPDPDGRNRHGVGAYATDDLETAEMFARDKAKEQGRLFGTVYEVSTLSDNPNNVDPYGELRKFENFRKALGGSNEKYIVDPKGLKVHKAVSFPINESAIWEGPREFYG